MSNEPSAVLSSKQYFWRQLVLLVGGIGGLALSHRIATGHGATSSAPAALATAALVVVALATVVWSASVIVASALSDAYRVFRSRHLVACSALLGSAAVTAGSLVVHGPFDRLLAHGQITGDDIADLGCVLAVFACTVGAAFAAAGAWEAVREERLWGRLPHVGGQRST